MYSKSHAIQCIKVLLSSHEEIEREINRFFASEDNNTINNAISLLRQHIWLEEEKILPYLTQPNIAVQERIVQAEHGELWKLADEIQAATNKITHRHVYRELSLALSRHNLKEEQVIYRSLYTEIAQGKCANIELNASRMPQGWVCRALSG